MIFLSFPRVECPIFFFSSSVTAEPTNRPLELVGGRRKFPVDLVYKGNCLSSILSTVKIDLLGPSAKTIDVYTVDILVFRQTIKRRRDETKGSTAGQTVSFSPPRRPKSWAPWRYYSTYVPSRREEMCIAMLRHWHFTHI